MRNNQQVIKDNNQTHVTSESVFLLMNKHGGLLSPAGCGGSSAGASPVPGLVLVHVPGPRPHAVWSCGWRSLPVPLLHPGGEQAAPTRVGKYLLQHRGKLKGYSDIKGSRWKQLRCLKAD